MVLILSKSKQMTIMLIALLAIPLAIPNDIMARIWIQTTQEDFLSGKLVGTDAERSPGNLSIQEGLHKIVFRNKDDFEENANHNVRVGSAGLTLLRYGEIAGTYDVSSAPSVTSFIPFWWDPGNGDMYVRSLISPKQNGFTILSIDGISRTYRASGVWDTTEDPDGILLSANPKIRTGHAVFHAWKDLARGDIYVSTDNGWLNVIHTQGTSDYRDDVVEIYTRGTTPHILTWDPVFSWMDEDRNLYVGFPHGNGFTVIYPDAISATYTDEGILDFSASGEPVLIRRTPKLGLRPSNASDEFNGAMPFFKDSRGNLYVGTNNGLTILYNTDSDRYYDTSVTYRTNGLWDTTEDNIGTLIRSDSKIPSNMVYLDFAWEDTNGDIYLDIRNGGAVIHRDGTVTTPVFVGRHRWKDENGDVYVSTGVLNVLHPDGTTTVYDSQSTPAIQGAQKSWVFQDKLYIANANAIVVLSPNNSGTSKSGVIDIRKDPAHSIRWNVNTPARSKIRLQTRVGGIGSYWIDQFDDATLPKVGRASSSGSFRMKVVNGSLVFYDFSRDILPLIDTESLSGPYPKGSIIRMRIRAVSSRERLRGIYGFVGSRRESQASTLVTVANRWAILSVVASEDFSRIGLSVPSLPRIKQLEVDWISVESSEGWTEWVDAKNPDGSVIPNLDAEHPYLQWRAILTTEDPAKALPTLEDVILASGYLPKATYISPAFDTQGLGTFKTISWDAEVPEGTSLKFQIRTASTQEGLEDASWMGPTRDESFYTRSGSAINPTHNGDRWIQYRVLFETEEETKTPVVKEVRIEYEVPTAVEEKARQSVPLVTSLAQNYPNPFNSETIIRYQLSETERIRLSVYNVFGQEVKRLMDGERKAGRHIVTWDGRDREGKIMASGIYFYGLQTDEYSQTKKMLLVR